MNTNQTEIEPFMISYKSRQTEYVPLNGRWGAVRVQNVESGNTRPNIQCAWFEQQIVEMMRNRMEIVHAAVNIRHYVQHRQLRRQWFAHSLCNEVPMR